MTFVLAMIGGGVSMHMIFWSWSAWIELVRLREEQLFGGGFAQLNAAQRRKIQYGVLIGMPLSALLFLLAFAR